MSLRGPAFLGFPNFVAQPYCTMSTPATAAGLVPAGFEPAYLKTEEPSDPARISSLDPLYTQWGAFFGKTGRNADGIGVANVNISPWGRYRFIGQTAITYINTAPDTLVAGSTNTSGVVGNVDELISSPDSSFLSPTVTTSAWDFKLDFATPSSAPIFGGTKAMFVVRVLLVGTPTSAYPKIAVSAYAAGVEISVLGSRAVTVATGNGQVLVFPFNLANGLYASNGSDIRFSASFEAGDGGSYAKVESVRLYTESTTPTRDSGWLASPVASYASTEDAPPPTTSLIYYPTSQWANVDSIGLVIADDQTDHDPDEGTASTGVPTINVIQPGSATAFVEAGRLDAGGVVFLARGVRIGGGPGVEVVIHEQGGQTVAGQTYGADSFRQRSMSMEIIATRDELLQLLNRVAWRRGASGSFFISAEPDIAATRQLFETFLTTARFGKAMPMPSRHDSGDGTMPWTVSIDFLEKL